MCHYFVDGDSGDGVSFVGGEAESPRRADSFCQDAKKTDAIKTFWIHLARQH